MSGLVLAGALAAFQRPFRQFPGREYEDFPSAARLERAREWTFARLMYPPSPYMRGGFRGRLGRRIRLAGGRLQLDHRLSPLRPAPVQAMRRLTRVNARSVEQPVNLDEGG